MITSGEGGPIVVGTIMVFMAIIWGLWDLADIIMLIKVYHLHKGTPHCMPINTPPLQYLFNLLHLPNTLHYNQPE